MQHSISRLGEPEIARKFVTVCLDDAALQHCKLRRHTEAGRTESGPNLLCAFDPSFAEVDATHTLANYTRRVEQDANYHDTGATEAHVHHKASIGPRYGGHADQLRHYSRIVHRKAELVLLGLRLGLSVMSADLDVVWLRNPLPLVHEAGHVQLAGFQCWRSNETGKLCKRHINTGVWFARHAPESMRLLEMWVDGGRPTRSANASNYMIGLPNEDQPKMNSLFHTIDQTYPTFHGYVHDPHVWPAEKTVYDELVEQEKAQDQGVRIRSSPAFIHAAPSIGSASKLSILQVSYCDWWRYCRPADVDPACRSVRPPMERFRLGVYDLSRNRAQNKTGADVRFRSSQGDSSRVSKSTTN